MKNYKLRITNYGLLIFMAAFLTASSARADYRKISCVIHIDSTFSGGEKTPLETSASRAAEKNIDVIIPTDHAIMRWEYGQWPLRGLIDKVNEGSSVIKAGPQVYLDEIKHLNTEYPDLLVIPGVETAAHYYWTGSIFKNNLMLNQWHKHMLVIGLDKPSDIYSLPLTSNPHAGKLNIKLLWPLLLLVAGLFFNKPRFIGYTLLFIGTLFLINSYPFKSYTFNQYTNKYGEKPYQNLINYANTKNALIYWAHPEAYNFREPVKIGAVNVTTKPYPESILNTEGYTGFAFYYEGYREAGSIGGYWDQVLLRYCSGELKKPVWAIGESDYSGNAEIDKIQNILWVKEKNKKEVLNSLKNGNSFVLFNAGITLKDYYVKSGNNMAICGEEIKYEGNPKIYIETASTNNKREKLKIFIIRNGKTIDIIEGTSPLRLIYEDKNPLPSGKNYYRIFIRERVVTNPVFVVR